MGLYRWIWLKPVYYVPTQPVPTGNDVLMYPWKQSVTLSSLRPLTANPVDVASGGAQYNNPPDGSSHQRIYYHQREGNSKPVGYRGVDFDYKPHLDVLADSSEDVDENSNEDGDSAVDNSQLALPYVMIFLGVITVILVSFCIHRKRFKARMSHRKHLRSLHKDEIPRDLNSRRGAIISPISQPRMQMLVPFRLDVDQLMVEIERQHYFKYNSSSMDSCELGIMPPGYYSTLYRRSSIYSPSTRLYSNLFDKRSRHGRRLSKIYKGTKDGPHSTKRRGARVQFAKQPKLKPTPNLKTVDEHEFHTFQGATATMITQRKPETSKAKSTTKTNFAVFNALSMKR